MESLNPLTAISPVDGRYRAHTEALAAYFSEYALMKYRLYIEVEYFIALASLPVEQLQGIKKSQIVRLRKLCKDFSLADAASIKAKEAVINHDVKAVEYFLKSRFPELGLQDYTEFVHFGLTSQDINNTAFPLCLKDSMKKVYLPQLERLIDLLNQKAGEWKEVVMLAHTHGQPASPTRLGKEIEVFAVRLQEQLRILKALPYPAKFGGATGNFNAHFLAYPQIDWHAFATRWLKKMGLTRSCPTTQIEHYDNLAAIFQCLSRINTILIDFSRDVWIYISMEYFKQKVNGMEVGSSAMPHKVNPIEFENAEGNLGLANALFGHLAAKLPISRLQRDLSDSTVLRNAGLPMAHSLLAMQSLVKGVNKLLLNQAAIDKDLDNNWAVIAEAIQTLLRREHFPKPYEALKELTRTGGHVSKESLHAFIKSLPVNETLKKQLLALSPFTYTGK